MQQISICLVVSMCALIVKCGYGCSVGVSKNFIKKQVDNSTASERNLNYNVSKTAPKSNLLIKNNPLYSVKDLENARKNNTALPITNNEDGHEACVDNSRRSIDDDGNETSEFRNIMDAATKIMPAKLTPTLSNMLAPALTLAGLLPWILPGIRMAAGFLQMVNQMVFMAGLAALVRSYVFDSRPDEHIVYVNNGYGNKGHSEHHV